jgi:hypothetical protein
LETGVTLASDAVCYDGEGIVRGFVSKVLPIIELNCAVGNVGLGNYAQAFVLRTAQRFLSFDQLLLYSVEEARATFDSMLSMQVVAREAPRGTIVLVGWSDERDRYESYKIHSRERKATNAVTGEMVTFEPWKLHDITAQHWCSNSPKNPDRFGLMDFPQTANDYAARMICASRADSGPAGEGDFEGIPYGVGGFLQMTHVQRGVISTWIAHRWPDEIGKIIDPSSGEPTPAFPV